MDPPFTTTDMQVRGGQAIYQSVISILILTICDDKYTYMSNCSSSSWAWEIPPHISGSDDLGILIR